MKTRSVYLVAMVFILSIAGGCSEADTEKSCASDQDCTGSRICSSTGECMAPVSSEEVEQEDAGVDATGDVTEVGGRVDSGPTIDADDADGGAGDAGEDTADTPEMGECPEANVRGRLESPYEGRWQSEVVETDPHSTIVLDASQSSGDISRYEWVIIDRPQEATGRFTPDANSEQVRLYLDTVGTYRFELRAYGEGAVPCVSVAEFEGFVYADGLQIQLTWVTPADTDQTDDIGTDLDLHYLHPNGTWNQSPWDIYWDNSTADWGDSGARGDPALAGDDSLGLGLERLYHSSLEPRTYRVGVHYFDDRNFGPSYATVRIYLRNALQFEFEMKYLEETNLFWEVATISWPSAEIVVQDRVTTGFP